MSKLKTSPTVLAIAPQAEAHQDARTAADDTIVTYKAAAAYLARAIYSEALKMDHPAKTLGEVIDSLPEVMPEVLQATGTKPDVAAALLPEVDRYLRAFEAIEHARTECGSDYGYALDVLADYLKRGANPQAVRVQIPDVVRRIHAAEHMAASA